MRKRERKEDRQASRKNGGREDRKRERLEPLGVCMSVCSVASDSLRHPWTSPLDSSVHGSLQARILEGVAISFSRGSSRPRDQTQVSHIAGRRFNL